MSQIEFRRNDRDRKRPRSVVTAQLMGDPSPDRENVSQALRQQYARNFRGQSDVTPSTTVLPKRLQALRDALGTKAMTIAELASAMSVSVSVSGERARDARKAGLVVEIQGRPKRYVLSSTSKG